MVSGIFVPSFDITVSRTTSVSAKLAGDFFANAVRATFPSAPIRPEPGVHGLVREPRDGDPIRFARPQELRDLAAVAVLDRGEDGPPVLGALERRFGDPREVPAERVGVLLRLRPELVEPDLLI